MVKSQDPQDQVLYQETGLGTYAMLSEIPEESLEIACTAEISTDDPKLWTMQFDGSCSTVGSSARVVIIYPEGRLYPFAYCFQFDCTKYTTKYEVLLLGLRNAKDMGIKRLRVEGDAKLIVKQVRDQFKVKTDRLRHYRNRVWNAIDWFEAFDIKNISHLDKSRADALTVSASLFMPHSDFHHNAFAI